MNHRKRTPKAIGSFLAILITMGFMATQASALWLENTGSGLKAITANKNVEISAHGIGILLVEKETDLKIECTVIENNGSELRSGTSEAPVFIIFKTCTTWQGGVNISANCTPIQPMIASAKAFIKLHEGKNVILFEPVVAGGVLIQIKFQAPCALPSTNNVRGTVGAECAKLSGGALVGVDCGASGIKVPIIKVNEALFTGDKTTYGTKAATLTGAAEVALTSFNEWCGHV